MCLQHGSYELPLRWRETPVKVSCPVSHLPSESDGPLSVCCSPHSMSVKVQEESAAELLRVNGKNGRYPVFQHTAIKCNVFVWFLLNDVVPFRCSQRTVDSSG